MRAVLAEDTPRAREMLAEVPPDARWSPAAAVRRTLLRRTPGLPYAIVTDGAGAICADHGGGLDERGVAAIVRQCAALP